MRILKSTLINLNIVIVIIFGILFNSNKLLSKDLTKEEIVAKMDSIIKQIPEFKDTLILSNVILDFNNYNKAREYKYGDTTFRKEFNYYSDTVNTIIRNSIEFILEYKDEVQPILLKAWSNNNSWMKNDCILNMFYRVINKNTFKNILIKNQTTKDSMVYVLNFDLIYMLLWDGADDDPRLPKRDWGKPSKELIDYMIKYALNPPINKIDNISSTIRDIIDGGVNTSDVEFAKHVATWPLYFLFMYNSEIRNFETTNPENGSVTVNYDKFLKWVVKNKHKFKWQR